MNGGFNDMQADDIEGQLENTRAERDYFREDRLRIAAERDALAQQHVEMYNDLAPTKARLAKAERLLRLACEYLPGDSPLDRRIDAFLAKHEDVR